MSIDRYSDGRLYIIKSEDKEPVEVKKRHKYGAIATIVDDIKFPTKLEARHYQILKQMLDAKLIKKIELQVPFVIHDKFTNIEGKKIREIKYVCDFRVTLNDDKLLVLDSKGILTDMFKTKRKLYEKRYNDIIYSIKKDSDLHKLILGGALNG